MPLLLVCLMRVCVLFLYEMPCPLQALADDRLARSDLSWLHPYQPSLSASWLFQRSMSFGVGQAAYPSNYPYTPPYYEASAPQAAELESAVEAQSSLVFGAGAGPAAAFQEAIAMAAARFGAGAADPADYFHEETELDTARPVVEAVEAVQMAVGVAVQARPTQSPEVAIEAAAVPAVEKPQAAPQEQFFERDFRSSPGWLRLPYSHVNEILGCNFSVMGVLGDRVLRPFLQVCLWVWGVG